MKRHLISPPHRSVPLEGNPLWFRDAIIYEARVRSFYDSNGDGVGDFAGLASKLDYLQDLGVTAIWLLPFYPSPQRDDGYDIADYTDIHPDCGTLADFDQLLNEAHRRGLRIITELVSRTERDVVFRALVYRDANDTEAAATGWAAEREGDGEINSVACLENTETSAIGRALANLGFTAARQRPSAEEMAKVARVRARQTAGQQGRP